MSYPRNRAANTCQIAILQVGGVEPPEIAIPRCEYIIAGQIFEIHASNLACACIWDLGGAVALSFSLCRVRLGLVEVPLWSRSPLLSL